MVWNRSNEVCFWLDYNRTSEGPFFSPKMQNVPCKSRYSSDGRVNRRKKFFFCELVPKNDFQNELWNVIAFESSQRIFRCDNALNCALDLAKTFFDTSYRQNWEKEKGIRFVFVTFYTGRIGIVCNVTCKRIFYIFCSVTYFCVCLDWSNKFSLRLNFSNGFFGIWIIFLIFFSSPPTWWNFVWRNSVQFLFLLIFVLLNRVFGRWLQPIRKHCSIPLSDCNNFLVSRRDFYTSSRESRFPDHEVLFT